MVGVSGRGRVQKRGAAAQLQESQLETETHLRRQDEGAELRCPSQLQAHLVRNLLSCLGWDECKSTHLPQVPEEGGAWLLPWSSSRAECLPIPPWESGSAWGPAPQPAGADQAVKGELIGRQEPTCLLACNGDGSVSGEAQREWGLC